MASEIIDNSGQNVIRLYPRQMAYVCWRAIIIKIKQASMPSLPSVGEKKALANLTMVKISQPNGLNSSFLTATAKNDPSYKLESLSYNRHIPKI